MNTSDTPQQPPTDGAAPHDGTSAAAPQRGQHTDEAPPSASDAAPPQAAADRPAQAAPPAPSLDEEDEGPQPGNVALPPTIDHEDDDGPAPGNEKYPVARPGQRAGGAAPGEPSTGAAKRRRRRKKARAGQPGQAGAEATSESPGNEAAPQDRARDNKKRKPSRFHDRERPAFNVGDVTFGKILEITEEALFIDLMGKGTAIFDRLELDLPDEDPNAPPEPEEAEEKDGASGEAEARPSAEAAPAQEPQAGEPRAEGENGVAAAPVDAPQPAAASEAPEAPAAQPPAATEPAAEAGAPAATDGAAAEAQQAAVSPAPTSPGADGQPSAASLIPPVVLEEGAHFVGIVHNDGGRGGLVVLTRHPRRVSRAKAKASAAFRDKTTVMGLVTGVIKGGVEVDVEGLRAFAPGSHVDLRLGADLTNLVGKRLPFYVTQYAKRGRDVVLSRKAILEAEAKKLREEAIKRLQVGAIVEGTVRSVVPFGAFVDVGDVEGLVPLTEMSHNRSEGPSDVFKAGEKVSVKITKIDDKGKVWLSRKATIPDPWTEVAKKYANGTRHTGKVVRIQPFGAFVELESGVDGLIHTADLATLAITKRIEHPEEVVKVGDSIDVVVAHVDAASHRIALHPALTGEAESEPVQRVQQYKMVKALIVGIEQAGLVVRIQGVTGRNARGFVTAAGTGTPRGTELRKVFPIGQVIEAKVMEIDPKRGEVKLSIKALNDESERNAYQQYRQQVNREARFTFGDLLAKKIPTNK